MCYNNCPGPGWAQQESARVLGIRTCRTAAVSRIKKRVKLVGMLGEMKEFELKLELAEKKLPDVAAVTTTDALATEQPCRQRILSTYFDTRKHALRDAGISLRVRRLGGGWMQTVKLDTNVKAGISNPTEIECSVPGKNPQLDLVPDRKVQKKLTKLVGKKKLRPVFRTDVLRTTHLIRSQESEVELALDGGSIETDAGSAAICEAELELKSGGPTELLEIAQLLFADIPFSFGSASKAERGYWLATSGKLPKSAPVKALNTGFGRKQSVSHAFARISQSASDQVVGNWNGIMAGDDPEFAHQMRVGLRRMRTAVRAFRGVIDTPELRTLARDLGQLGRHVGELRDADVLLSDITKPVLQSSGSLEGARELEILLQGHSSGAREQLREELQKSGWNALLLHVSLLPHGVGWEDQLETEQKVGHYAPTALKKCWKPVIRRARRLNELDTEERHSLRKNLKTLRYTLEFFAPVLPVHKTQNFIGHLKGLQDSFGYLNDVALAQTLPDIVSSAENETPHLNATVEHILAWHSQRADHAWLQTQQQWQRLKEQPRPWK